MSDPAGGGHHGGGGMGVVWQWLIILLIVVFLNVIGAATGQLGNFFSMLKFNTPILLIIAAIIFINKAMK